MTTAGNTPNFVAGSDIPTFACVRIVDGTSFTVRNCVASDADEKAFIGVTDGSVRGFRSTVHAQSGDTVVLQNSNFVQLKCASTAQIAAGDLLTFDAGGAVRKINIDVVERAFFVAAENAEYGEIFWAQRIGAYDEISPNALNKYEIDPIVTTGATTTTYTLQGLSNQSAIPTGSACATSLLILGSNADATVIGSYRINVVWKLDTTVPVPIFSIVGSQDKTVIAETNAALNANVVLSGGEIVLEVTGIAGETINWKVIAQQIVI